MLQKTGLHLLSVISLSALCVALCFVPGVSAQDETVINVTFTCSYGGLLWVNGSSVVNASVVPYLNNTVLNLAATPTNANYSFASFDLNGTLSTDNPVLYNLTSTELSSNQSVSVLFVAEAVPTPSPTPDPDAVTAEDALAVGVAFGIVAIGVCAALIFVVAKRKQD